jgi:YD repeat-containing protein
VREAVVADGDAVGVLTERVYSAGGWTDAAYSRQLLDGRSRIEQATVLVASRADAIVGIARPGTPFAAICEPDEVEVRMLAVDQRARGQGVASLLMDACENLARQERVAGIVLSTEPDMHAAPDSTNGADTPDSPSETGRPTASTCWYTAFRSDDAATSRDNSGRTVTYTYDAAGLLASVTDPENRMTRHREANDGGDG